MNHFCKITKLFIQVSIGIRRQRTEQLFQQGIISSEVQRENVEC